MKTRELALWVIVLAGLAALHGWPMERDVHAGGLIASVTIQDGDQDAESDDEAEDDDDELTLEKLFGDDRERPGPSARSMAFSHDGRYGAYLYTPYLERRHGADIFIYDTESGEVMRLTKVSVMADYQESAREVQDDRVKKARQRERENGNGENDAEGDNGNDDGDNAQNARRGRRGGRGGRGDAPSIHPALTQLDANGTWEGRLTSNQDIGLPPDGLPFTLTINVAADGSVSGQFETDLVTTQITSGDYDAETGRLTCTLTDPTSAMVGELMATIDGDDMTATIRVDALNATLNLKATRTGDGGGGGAMQRDQDDNETDDDDEELEDLSDDERKRLGDTVGEKDADDDRAPRYSGVGSFAWSPVGHEMIFSSEGDLYRLMIENGDVDRLTRTQENERGVDYLPDGSGYAYMSGDSLIKVSFGSHLREQMDPQLPDQFTLDSYQISPDGNRVIILASKGGSAFGGGGTVNIISYRGRLAQVREVPRMMPPDEFPDIESKVFYFNLGDFLHEKSELAEVFSHKHTGPRDIMRVPEWAPDSSRVAFSVFDQGSGHVGIYEAVFPDEIEEDDAPSTQQDDDDNDDQAGGGRSGRGRFGRGGGGGARRMDVKQRPAKLVYRFFHNGGPNTPGMIVPFYLDDSRRLAFLTELSGFRHLHILDPLYESLTQVTSGQWELYPIEVSRDHKRIFATATKGDPSQEHVYVIDLESHELTQLTTTEGVYNGAAVSPDGTHVLANQVDWGKLSDLYAIDAAGEMKQLSDEHPEEAYELIEPVPQYFTYKNRHGHTIHGHMFTPPGWEPSDDDKRPLVVYVYGGPLGNRKMIDRGAYSSPSYYFAYYMAKKHGYITCTIDPRGMSGYGGLFEKSSFEGVGRAQTEDLVDGIKWMVENHHVDAEKVGMHGWSFGGFQTQMVMYTEPDVLACGIAGAGPTEWVNYNSWYTTGTIGTRDNIKDDPNNEKYSLVPLAKNLKGELMLVHGMEDSNVLYQDTVKVYQALLQADKETLVELFLDPTGGHGLGGDVDTLKRYRKFEEFFVRHLGSTPPADDDAGDDDVD